ncbi:hypothetical protein [Mucilaginibacter sp. SP1R1]|uniref:hypothetical protein n=1 Tax=Mucilaginibacter sp. SP1R1 TaxID=2723091 RepID=UPI001619E2E0|nr:hypothetical protein [Mucilaginibacter sp. SP1R1]MBB6149509.1 hypothetical protein [Mucilaginibacter sp. SP1R1]
MEALITYMFQLTLAFMVIQVCIPIVIIAKSKYKGNKTKYNVRDIDRKYIEVDEIDHQHFLHEIDEVLNVNHISHYDDRVL